MRQLSLFFLLYALPVALFAQEQVNLLVPDLPIIGETTNLAEFLTGIFRLSLGLAVTAAIVIIVWNGIRYMTTDIVNSKGDALSWIKDALWGLVLAFATVLILRTINPELTEFKFLETLQDVGDAAGGTGNDTPGDDDDDEDEEPETCSNCVALTSPPFNITAGCGGSCTIAQATLAKLEVFRGRVDNPAFPNQVRFWRITEAYPPSVTHQNQCHQNGTCIDANFQTPIQILPNTTPTTAQVSAMNIFLNGAIQSGLGVCYEVKTQQEKDAWVNGGVVSSRISVIPQITAPHFSVYQSGVTCNQ